MLFFSISIQDNSMQYFCYFWYICVPRQANPPICVVFLYGWGYTTYRRKVVSAATSIPYGRKNNRFSLLPSVFNKFKLIKLFRCGILTSCYNAFVGNWVRLHCWEVKRKEKRAWCMCWSNNNKKCLVYFVWSFNLTCIKFFRCK